MRVSSTGLDLIRHFEGLDLTSSMDPAGRWRIGYGHLGDEAIAQGDVNVADAERLLHEDLEAVEAGILQLVKVDLDQNQFDALASFVFNIGLPAFKKSIVLKRLNKGNFLGAADAMAWWSRAVINRKERELTGLIRRRAAERALFLETVGTGEVGDESRDASNLRPLESRPRRRNFLGSRTLAGAFLAGASGAVIAGASFMDGAPFRLASSYGEPESGTLAISSLVDAEGFMAADYQEVFQLAGAAMIVVAVLYIIYARFDDWLQYRR
ncbi:MAG: lysozyme [Aquisalinus sp.]|nr:lysozyme [Aquisalinus sp.]